jgi:hypothetical protein
VYNGLIWLRIGTIGGISYSNNHSDSIKCSVFFISVGTISFSLSALRQVVSWLPGWLVGLLVSQSVSQVDR